MSRKYTAQEMRDYADAIAGDLVDNEHTGVEYFYDDLIPVIEALRQAADMMEKEEKRESRYEYAAKSNYDGVVYAEHCDESELRDHFSSMQCDEYTVVRRAVGEWEEVKE